jgi:hypothetical protein
MVINDTRYAHEIRTRVTMANVAINKNESILSRKLDLNCKI